jgi:hypothetical protein
LFINPSTINYPEIIMALTKRIIEAVPVPEKNNAVAFVNWSLPLADGRSLRSAKGFPIFQNPKYPNKHEDMLVALAKKHGGSVTVTMECRIVINSGSSVDDFDLESILVVAPVTTPEFVPVQ